MKKIQGITLVSTVITIIILLVLAGISIQALTNQGLFGQAENARKETKRAQVTEWLNLKLIEVQMNNPTGTAEEIVEATRLASDENEELAKMGKNVVVDTNTSTIEDGEPVAVYFYVQVDEDVYKVEMEGAKFIGEAGKFPPVITLESISSTTNSITIKIKTSRNEEGKIEFYIKKEGETEYTPKYTAEGEESKGLEYTFTGLEQNKKYSIKIVATAKNGQVKEYTKDITLDSVPSGVGVIIFSPIAWSNEKASTTISSTETAYTIQYQINSTTGTWITGTSVTGLLHGDKLYARLWDGTNGGEYATNNIFDGTLPVTATISVGEINTEKNVVLTAIGNDNESGISEYEIYVNGNKVSSTNTYTITNMPFYTDYSCYAIVTDNAGNKKQSSTITVKNEQYVKDALDFKNFATEINSGNNFNGKTITQTADIDLQCNENNQYILIREWFDGTYNGDYHYIKNLYINRSDLDVVGLFSTISANGKVENLRLSADITGGYVIGGIAGSVSSGKIINCSFEGNISGEGETGGITGTVYHSGKIEGCKNLATVKTIGDAWSAGGIAGSVGHNSIVSYCYNVGDIENAIAYGAGGIAGTAANDGYISYCYNLGNVKSVDSAGGIVGMLGHVESQTKGYINNCIASSECSIISTNNGYNQDYIAGRKVQNCYVIENSYVKTKTEIYNSYNIFGCRDDGTYWFKQDGKGNLVLYWE